MHRRVRRRLCISVELPFCCAGCWLFIHNVPYRFFCAGVSTGVEKKAIRPHYVNIASARFFWRVFLSAGCAAYCFLLFRGLVIDKEKSKKQCVACVMAAKTMTKKTGSNTLFALRQAQCAGSAKSR